MRISIIQKKNEVIRIYLRVIKSFKFVEQIIFKLCWEVLQMSALDCVQFFVPKSRTYIRQSKLTILNLTKGTF